MPSPDPRPETLDREAIEQRRKAVLDGFAHFDTEWPEADTLIVTDIPALLAALLTAEQRAEEAERQLRWAIQLLRREEWHAGRTHKDHCPTCGYPKVRGHEPGCSLDAVLNGRPAPRLDRCNDAPLPVAPHKAAEEEQC